ncbi:MAG: DEAD/DEAH box helicase, partial [bacterium]|nr:DEAD/DEAH box helicase [bacterium]
MSSTFGPLGLSPTLCTVLGELGYAEPTPVQAESIPVLLEGVDLMGQSKTGSGKTAAFALPILQRVRVESRVPQALVLCPTRELAAQVARVVRTLGRKHPGLAVLEIVGGQRARAQMDALERGVHIAVGTPGRVLDLLERRALDPRALTTVVLDEADRMLDMGFGPDVEAILGATPRTRQTVMFSATLPESILSLSKACQRSAVRVHIDEPAEALPEIREQCLVVAPEDKFHALCWLLHAHPHESALIFCNFKATVLELQRAFSRAGVSADRFDGDLEQFHRDQVLA